jgi:bifunctional ADP-heptose synthase (sugar kinase/adenylyltransferase)
LPALRGEGLDIPAVSAALPNFDDYDLVLVADFGHGLLDARDINQRIASRKRCTVAAMAQVNSSNYGYNLPVKYVGADYYSLNRDRGRALTSREGPPAEELLERMSRLLNCRRLSVTDGSQGAIVRMNDEVFSLPTLSTSIIDTIGCGDAYFALSSLAAALGLPARLVGLAGSIGAARWRSAAATSARSPSRSS